MPHSACLPTSTPWEIYFIYIYIIGPSAPIWESCWIFCFFSMMLALRAWIFAIRSQMPGCSCWVSGENPQQDFPKVWQIMPFIDEVFFVSNIIYLKYSWFWVGLSVSTIITKQLGMARGCHSLKGMAPTKKPLYINNVTYVELSYMGFWSTHHRACWESRLGEVRKEAPLQAPQ